MFEAGAMARSVTQARVCPILFGITKSEWNLRGGPLSFFQAAEFTEDDFRKLQKTINNGRLGEADLREMFDVWWPKLKEKIEAITIAPQPVLKEPDQKELLQEILGLTRSLVREVQGPLPWLRFRPPLHDPEMDAFIQAERRRMAETPGGILSGITRKSE
jgi:hypothetical protein